MCLCNGTGGITIQHSWGIETQPCPDGKCDFDKEKAIQELDQAIAKLKREMSEVA